MVARRDGYEVDDDPERIDVDSAWGYLRGAYWSENVPREVVARAIAGSLSFGLYAADGSQVGFARAVTDRATYAWIADVYVLERERGRGLGVWLIETRDAHGLYERFGFVREGERTMVLRTEVAELYGSPAEKLTE